jgi:hypothetical protein
MLPTSGKLPLTLVTLARRKEVIIIRVMILLESVYLIEIGEVMGRRELGRSLILEDELRRIRLELIIEQKTGLLF